MHIVSDQDNEVLVSVRLVNKTKTMYEIIQGSSQGGLGTHAPSQKMSPPIWNDTFYRGLWREAILSHDQPPEPPLLPLYFEKFSYAPVQTLLNAYVFQ